MSKTVRILGLAALLAGASVVWAQDSGQSEATETQDAAQEDATEAETTEGEAPAADGNTADGLSTGIPVDDEPQVGQTYIKERHTDWEVRCVLTADGKDPCQLYQLLKDAQGTSVAEISMFNLPAGGEAVAGATVITPLETLLTAQLLLSVDGGKGKRYPYSFCSNVGCFSRVGFTAAEVEQFKQGNSAKAVIIPAAAPDETVDLTISLSGFTAGWNAVIAANADNQ